MAEDADGPVVDVRLQLLVQGAVLAETQLHSTVHVAAALTAGTVP